MNRRLVKLLRRTVFSGWSEKWEARRLNFHTGVRRILGDILEFQFKLFHPCLEFIVGLSVELNKFKVALRHFFKKKERFKQFKQQNWKNSLLDFVNNHAQNRKCLIVGEFSRVDLIKQLSILLISRSGRIVSNKMFQADK